jgi:hypothetical protein
LIDGAPPAVGPGLRDALICRWRSVVRWHRPTARAGAMRGAADRPYPAIAMPKVGVCARCSAALRVRCSAETLGFIELGRG